MRPPRPNSSDRPDLLQAWEITPTRNPAFRTEVWRLIHGQTAASDWVHFFKANAASIVACLALAVAVGAWTGRERAHANTEADRAMLAANYVQALDARTMRMP